jgi:hypothetical protein
MSTEFMRSSAVNSASSSLRSIDAHHSH